MIRNTLLVAFLVLVLSASGISQSYIGFKGGVNRSRSAFAFNIETELITARRDFDGFYFSFPLEVHLNDFINFLPELVLTSEGAVLSVQTKEEERTYNNTILYAELPLLGKLKLLKNKDYELGLIAGIVPAYALDVQSYFFTLSDLNKSTDIPIDFEDAGLSRFDLSLSIGVNTEKEIAKDWKVVLDLRYNMGILDLEKHTTLTNTTESVSLTLGIMVPLKKKNRTH